MLKGSRTGVVKRVQPMSVHGQQSLDILWVDPDDPEEELRHARIGAESVPAGLAAGDRVQMHYVLGSVVRITT